MLAGPLLAMWLGRDGHRQGCIIGNHCDEILRSSSSSTMQLEDVRPPMRLSWPRIHCSTRNSIGARQTRQKQPPPPQPQRHSSPTLHPRTLKGSPAANRRRLGDEAHSPCRGRRAAFLWPPSRSIMQDISRALSPLHREESGHATRRPTAVHTRTAPGPPRTPMRVFTCVNVTSGPWA